MSDVVSPSVFLWRDAATHQTRLEMLLGSAAAAAAAAAASSQSDSTSRDRNSSLDSLANLISLSAKSRRVEGPAGVARVLCTANQSSHFDGQILL